MINISTNQISLFEDLKEYIIDFHGGKIASGGKEITKKCHFCGDSMDPKSRHLYIGIQKNTGLLTYQCFKCHAQGLVDGKFIRQLSMGDDVSGLCLAVNNYNKEIYSKPQNRILRDIESITIRNPNFSIRESQESILKMKKFNKRLGVNLSPQDFANLKIVVNLKDFLYFNNISTYTRNQEVIDYLDMYFLGFSSIDNSYITLRRMIDEGKLPEFIDRRYINYNIFGKQDNSFRHYVLPGSVNVLDPRPIKIYITEGIFDSQSLYFNVVEDKSQCIFSAVCGSSYINIARFFIENYGFINCEFHICPDADISNEKMYWISEQLKAFNMPIYIHRNLFPGEKDFGVSIDRIKEGIIRIY